VISRLLLGGFDLIEITDNIVIRRTPLEVFDFISDLENLPKWQSEVVTSTVLTPGPTRIGTRFSEDVKMGPRRTTATCEVIEYKPGSAMGFTATSPAMDYQSRLVVDSLGDGTKLTLTAKGQLKGWWRLMQPLLTGEFKSGVRKELMAVKTVLEGSDRT
jgi:hypothetical protein